MRLIRPPYLLYIPLHTCVGNARASATSLREYVDSGDGSNDDDDATRIRRDHGRGAAARASLLEGSIWCSVVSRPAASPLFSSSSAAAAARTSSSRRALLLDSTRKYVATERPAARPPPPPLPPPPRPFPRRLRARGESAYMYAYACVFLFSLSSDTRAVLIYRARSFPDVSRDLTSGVCPSSPPRSVSPRTQQTHTVRARYFPLLFLSPSLSSLLSAYCV